jgi:biopolymer transport protein ExbB
MFVAALGFLATVAPIAAQDETDDRLTEAERLAEEALTAPADEAAPARNTPTKATNDESPNLFQLWWKGGELMYPITFMSFVVLVFAIERSLALRRRKVMPPALTRALGELASRPGGLDPRQAYKLCQQHPSTLASVIRAVLLKLGRPHSEVEMTLKETSEREAAKLYKNVRPINLATSLTPLLGLLGTVQGMIACFYQTANMGADANKVQVLSSGIYVALVTTFGGLVVAIPAAGCAHYLEGRIQGLFRDIEETLLGLLPQLERYEGKLRVTRQGLSTSEAERHEVVAARKD